MSVAKRPTVDAPHGPGRPRTVCTPSDSGSTVTTYLPTREHDRLVELAHQSGQSLSATIRGLLFSTDK
jgi:hypothetical protein